MDSSMQYVTRLSPGTPIPRKPLKPFAYQHGGRAARRPRRTLRRWTASPPPRPIRNRHVLRSRASPGRRDEPRSLCAQVAVATRAPWQRPLPAAFPVPWEVRWDQTRWSPDRNERSRKSSTGQFLTMPAGSANQARKRTFPLLPVAGPCLTGARRLAPSTPDAPFPHTRRGARRAEHGSRRSRLTT